MSFEALAWVFKHSPYSGAELLVHIAIADKANDDYGHLFFMRQNKVGQMMRMSRSTVSKSLKKMVDDGFVEVVRDNARNGRDDPNVYRFLMPDTAELKYDPSSRTGIPGDARDSVQARTARSHQLAAKQREYDEYNPTLPLEGEEQPHTGSGSLGDNSQENVSMLAAICAASGGGEEDDAPPPPGEPEEQQPTSEQTALAPDDLPPPKKSAPPSEELPTLEELAQSRREFPNEAVDTDDNAALNKMSGDILGHYLVWRKATGLGKLKTPAWTGIIRKNVKSLLLEGVSPSDAIEAVYLWHDDAVEMHRQGKSPLQPGAIVTKGRWLHNPDTSRAGVDGAGTTREQQTLRDRGAALQLLRQELDEDEGVAPDGDNGAAVEVLATERDGTRTREHLHAL